ncbi:MAG: DNA repair protein RecO [Bryobacteraceae bacterium]
MPARVSEAIVLRTYPLKEADLVVSFLSRDQGKLRGVARRARRPRNSFGSGLERLSHVRMSYFQRENRELAALDSCELIHSQFGLLPDYTASVALDYLAEVTDQLLPAGEPNERFFRLLVAVLDHLGSGAEGSVWRGVTYFSIWALRLSGLLPELHVCLRCGLWLDDPEAPQAAFFARGRAGLVCASCRGPLDLRDAWELCLASRKMAGEMLQKPPALAAAAMRGPQEGADLRRFLVQQIESHVERKLVTAPMMEALA